MALPLTTNDNRMGQATLSNAFSDDVKLTVSSCYCNSAIREFGSLVDPDLAPVNPAMPIPLLSLSRRAGKSMQL
jgi:iron complex outermembrane receptor protein